MELARLKRSHPDNKKAYSQVQKKVHLALVDLNYCTYYPTNQEYRPLRDWRQLGAAVPATETSLHGTPAQLWKLIEDCMRNGRLDQLHNGEMDEEQASEGTIRQEPGEDPAGTLPRFLDSNDGLGDPRPQHNGESKGQIPHHQPSFSIGGGAEHPNPRDKDDREIQPSPDFQGDPRSPSMDSDKVMTNIDQDEVVSESESGEVLPSDRSYSSEHGDDSGSDDSMKRYANSYQPPKDTQRGRVLADLRPTDWNAQVRYFHVLKDQDSIDPNTPICCLSCGKAGHMDRDCEYLCCAGCGAYNKHITLECPDVARCSKCREVGHKESNCPYKLNKLARHELICDLCHQDGHTEKECELLWRTSGAPWESDIPRSDVNIFCYECGTKGHLGNDCSSRRPGKSLGTSTWSLSKTGPTPFINDEISIKGRARQPPPPPRNSRHDDDLGNFYRLKQPQRQRGGQIKINVGNKSTIDNSAPQWIPTGRERCNVPPPPQYRSYGPSQSHFQPRDHIVDGHPPPPHQYQGHYNARQPRQMGQYPVRPPPPSNSYRPMPSSAQNAWSTYRS